jgi:hypothetical protein
MQHAITQQVSGQIYRIPGRSGSLSAIDARKLIQQACSKGIPRRIFFLTHARMA